MDMDDIGVTLRDMGRPPEPTHLQLLKGRAPGRDSGGRVVPEDAFSSQQGRAFEPPDWLTDDVALDEWEHTAPTLTRLKLTKPEDHQTFAVYCQTVANYVRAQTKLSKEGLTIKTMVGLPNGAVQEKPIANPLVGVTLKLSTELLKYAKEFGLTPVASAALSRARSEATGGAVPDDATNPFAAGGTK